MKTVGTDTISLSSESVVVNLSTYNYSPDSPDDYFVLLNSNANTATPNNSRVISNGCYVTNKTKSQFTINGTANNQYAPITVSYQIIALK